MFSLPLNSENLPYPDPIHPIVVHFVIAMVLFSFICDVLGYFTHNIRLFEVAFWNMFVAAIAIFVAIIFGQFEAGLAQVYPAVESTLNFHTVMGWSLGAIVAIITAWRFAIRDRNPLKVPPAYLGAATFLICLVFLQVYLGSKLFWVYGLHVEPVVEAMKHGVSP
ncbi:membrane protein [Nostoc piscinale CENA21]|uniref:Membrane protein n=1 Tax=Nostoc piscinale CENA21 TaxID=224013 RepID=A0A0M4T193_9NOSO|nr:membrane protein [Nostoc piscinale CENA21]